MARQVVGRVLVSVGTLALILVGAIVAVKTLSDRDAITLVQGLAVFAISISVWIAMVVWLWSAWLIHERAAARTLVHDAAAEESLVRSVRR
jgi:hypothetical protein